MPIVNEIITQYPDYKRMANCAFNKVYNQWSRPMYQDNDVFVRARQNYSNVTTRSQIIELFKSERYYAGYLCTLVWGRIGSNKNSRRVFNDAFSVTEDGVEKRLVHVKELLQKGDIEGCCRYLYKGNGHFLGVGVSFYTKLMYFIGEAFQIPKEGARPLIFDTKCKKILKAIRNDQGIELTANSGIPSYMAFNTEMHRMANELELPSAGHLEALLFNCAWDIIENHL